MEWFIGGGVLVYLLFLIIGDKQYKRTQKAVAEEDNSVMAGCIAVSGAFVLIALAGVAFLAVSMMAIAAGGTW